MSEHTLLPWRQGRTLLTLVTRKWSPDRVRDNDKREKKKVFANFHDSDQGMSRSLICECCGPDAEDNANFIVKACNCHDDLIEAAEQALIFIESRETTHGRNFGAGNALRYAITKAKEA